MVGLKGLREEGCRLFLDARDAGPAGREAVGRLAFRAGGGLRRREAAMMADELAAESVIDQPGVAMGTRQAEAAGAAQGQRRVAAAGEEHQRLLLAPERDVHRLPQARPAR